MSNAFRIPLPKLDLAARTRWMLSNEADHVEELYGKDAIAWVRMRIADAPRGQRQKLYRLHDELARRRTPTHH